MSVYRAKKHPAPMPLSRGLRSLPPPAPATGRVCAPLTQEDLLAARLRRHTRVVEALTERIRDMRAEVASWE